MTPPTTVLPYDGSDLAAIVGLARELQAHDHALYPLMSLPDQIGASYVEHLLTRAAAHNGALLVARHNGHIAGYAALLTEVQNEDADEVPNSYAYVADLVVSQRLRGLGIGQALLDECERLARANGQKRLRLSVLAGNKSARAFYEAWGLNEHLLMLNKELP